jgi:hypothetical protein
MDDQIIKAVIDAGFTPYMRNTSDSYMYYTDGARVAYLQIDRLRGVTLSTVHIPNRTTGTGFSLADDLYGVTKESLESAFMHSPSWANRFDRESVKKFGSMEAFLTSTKWNGDFKPVTLETASS